MQLNKQRRRLCFWMENLHESFTLNLLPQPPFWFTLDQILAWTYLLHIKFVALEAAPLIKVIAVPPPTWRHGDLQEEKIEELMVHGMPFLKQLLVDSLLMVDVYRVHGPKFD